MTLEEIEAKWDAACANYHHWINYNHPVLGVNNLAIHNADTDRKYWYVRLVTARNAVSN